MSVMFWSLGKLVRPWDSGRFGVLTCWGMDRGEDSGEGKGDVRILWRLPKACQEAGGGNPLSLPHPIFSCSLALVTPFLLSQSPGIQDSSVPPEQQGKQRSVQAGGEDSGYMCCCNSCLFYTIVRFKQQMSFLLF